MTAGRAMNEGISWLVLGDQPTADNRSSPSRRPKLQLLGDDLEFRMLGQMEVLRGAERLAVGGHRQRAVLAVLVTEAGRVVSFDRLVDALWGDAPPHGSRATVHAYVSKLRRVLEPHRRAGTAGRLLATRAFGYVLDVDPQSVDVRRFERLAKEGRAALAAGDPEAAAELLARGLSLWRGPALADFAFEPFAAGEIARLEELRLSVTEDQLEAVLALGRHLAVVAELENLVAAHPFRERLRAQLMIALYRSGRQAEALRAYQAGRRVLGEELGIEPSPTLRALEAAMLRQENSLEWVPGGLGIPTAVTDKQRETSPPAFADQTVGGSSETVTFLRSNLDGLTRLWADHPARAAVVVARHDELVAEAVAGHGGNLSADSDEASVLGVFPRAGEALAAALALQRALAAESWPEAVTVEVRLGLHTREVAAGDGEGHRPGVKLRPRTQRRKLGVA